MKHSEKLKKMKNSSDRALYKAEVLSELFTGSKTFQKNGVRFTVSQLKVDGPILSVKVAASDQSGTLPLDNPYQFVNPPIVHDGKENLDEAFMQMVYDAVAAVAKQKGWTPSQP